jgi:predicted  nucleic acid-binding Zn-ribbon protein
MRIRPQMLNEIREGTKVIVCENCGRILYWPVKPEGRTEGQAEGKTG